MKYIEKNPEPAEILEWKANDKMYQRGKPNWKRFPTELKELLREYICAEQGHICCYCERRLNPKEMHLEHFKPKDKNKFPLNQLDYDNLFCSCQLELEKGEPRHCGNSKGSWFDEGLIVSPLEPNCQNRFKYTFDGQVFPNNQYDIGAQATIERLKLDTDKLNKLREMAIEPFLDEDLTQEDLERFVQEYLIEKDDNGGLYNEFYTTIKFLFES
jgi:uncharacterized protein (TIGR02646 family)